MTTLLEEMAQSVSDAADIHLLSAAKLRALNHAAILAITDRKGNITFVNDRFCEISGYSRQELIGQNHRIINSGYHSKEFFGEMWKTISSGDDWRGEICNRAKDGSHYWVDTSIAPVQSNEGKVSHYVAVRFVITDRKRAELDLQRSNRELEQFAYVASHDLQSPLRHIATYVGFLKEDLGAHISPELSNSMQVIGSAVSHMRLLIEDLLQFSRVGRRKLELKMNDLNQLLKQASAQVRESIDEASAEIIAEELPVWMCDRGPMVQVFSNIIGNAVKYRRKGTTPVVKISFRVEGDWLQINFADNGIGIKLEHQQRIFEIFQRLHSADEYEGSGIGLAITKKVVERHGGYIKVQSEPDQGSTFSVYLPRFPLV